MDADGVTLGREQWQILLARQPVEIGKLFLLGYGGVGKTALRKALKERRALDHEDETEDDPTNPMKRTLGVEYDLMFLEDNGNPRLHRNLSALDQFWMSINLRSTELIPVCIQDHGGQEEFHVVHDMFFQSVYGMYAIVIRADRTALENVESILRYWLRFACSTARGGRTVCLILYTIQFDDAHKTRSTERIFPSRWRNHCHRERLGHGYGSPAWAEARCSRSNCAAFQRYGTRISGNC